MAAVRWVDLVVPFENHKGYGRVGYNDWYTSVYVEVQDGVDVETVTEDVASASSSQLPDALARMRAKKWVGDGPNDLQAVLPPLLPETERLRVVPIGDVESKFYLRFSVVDRPGVLSFISGVLGKQKVSIATCHQRGRSERGSVPVIMITHHAREGAVQAALSKIAEARTMVKRKTVAIRIEE